MNKNQIKQALDQASNQDIFELDINLYQNDIKHATAAFLSKLVAESKRTKKPRIKLVAVLGD
jgi:hypothetical protein